MDHIFLFRILHLPKIYEDFRNIYEISYNDSKGFIVMDLCGLLLWNVHGKILQNIVTSVVEFVIFILLGNNIFYKILLVKVLNMYLCL